MRKPLNKFLEKRGYRLIKIPRFVVLLEHLLRKLPDFKFVQVGANDGVSFDGLYQVVTKHRCSGLVIEPLPDVFETLRLNYLHYPRIVPLNIALHAEQTSATIYRVVADKVGQLEKPWMGGIASFSPDHADKWGVPPEFIIKQQVPCAPLMETLVKYNALDAHLLQVDTEGYDAEIIKMIDFSRFRPALIKYERVHVSAAAQAETLQRLASAGYKVIHDGADTIASLA